MIPIIPAAAAAFGGPAGPPSPPAAGGPASAFDDLVPRCDGDGTAGTREATTAPPGCPGDSAVDVPAPAQPGATPGQHAEWAGRRFMETWDIGKPCEGSKELWDDVRREASAADEPSDEDWISSPATAFALPLPALEQAQRHDTDPANRATGLEDPPGGAWTSGDSDRQLPRADTSVRVHETAVGATEAVKVPGWAAPTPSISASPGMGGDDGADNPTAARREPNIAVPEGPLSQKGSLGGELRVSAGRATERVLPGGPTDTMSRAGRMVAGAAAAVSCGEVEPADGGPGRPTHPAAGGRPGAASPADAGVLLPDGEVAPGDEPRSPITGFPSAGPAGQSHLANEAAGAAALTPGAAPPAVPLDPPPPGSTPGPRPVGHLRARLGRAIEAGGGLVLTPSAESSATTPLEQAAPAATPRETVPAGDIGRQVVRAVLLSWRNGVGEARVRLEPESLGTVTVVLRVERGTVIATVSSDLAAVRESIQAHERDLRAGLASQGLDLDRLVVTEDGGRGDAREQDSRSWRAPRRHAHPSARRFELDA